MPSHKFGFDIAKLFLPVMEHLINDRSLYGRRHFTRAVCDMPVTRSNSNVFLSGDISQVCESCLHLLSVMRLIAAPPGGRGWRPGTMGQVCIFVSEPPTEAPAVTGTYAPGPSVGPGTCNICMASSEMFDSVIYAPSGASETEHRWSLVNEKTGNRWQFLPADMPDYVAAAFCEKNPHISGEIFWLQLRSKTANVVDFFEGKFTAPMDADQINRANTNRSIRYVLGRIIGHALSITPWDDKFSPSTAVASTWSHYDERIWLGDDHVSAALTAFDAVVPISMSQPLKNEAIFKYRGDLLALATTATSNNQADKHVNA